PCCSPRSSTRVPRSSEMKGLREFWRRFSRRSSALVGLLLLGAIALMAILGPLLAPGDPWESVGQPFMWPGQDPSMPLGSDILGRDILRGVLNGAGVSLIIGLSAAAAALTIGVLVGAFAGYFRG